MTLTIFGISNPNNIGNEPITGFSMGLLDKDGKPKGLALDFGSIIVTDTPDIIEIIDFNHTNPYVRYEDNYRFEINSYQKILDSNNGSLLYVDYPSDFIMDVNLAKCSTSEFFSIYSICNVANNIYTLSNANKEYDTLTQGSFNISITNHRNAEFGGLTAPIVVMNYDTKTRKVLSKSYGTLSRSYGNFSLDGLELMVNSL